MADQIMISLADVSAVADKIASINSQLTDHLNDIGTAMSNLSETWKSDASETIRSKMAGMTPTFEKYHEVIESYVAFLKETVRAYTENETAINAAASAFES